MSVEIRRAQRGDVQAIQTIYNEAVLTSTASYDTEPQPLELRLRWFDEHERTGYPIYVASDDGMIVGWSGISPFRPRPGYRFTAENSVYVKATHRRLGLGKQLMSPLIVDAKAARLHTILAVIGDSGNKASVKLHKSLGFKEVAVLPEVGFKFGRWLDQVWMQLML
jgi:phosphinothricin acetyltransferase